jgi:hypothetical protein
MPIWRAWTGSCGPSRSATPNETGTFTTKADACLTNPHAVGARHEWTSPNAEQLAYRVARDLHALFPRLAAS